MEIPNITDIVKYKNPLDIIKFCHYNNWKNIVNDTNSFLWNSLIKTHFHKYIKYKNDNLSPKDYYVLLYYSELIGVLDQPNILDRCQDLIQLLPKIYNNDHITIINACYNTAITTNKAKIILYRSKKDETILNHTYPSGVLRYQYLNSEKDAFIDENNVRLISKAKNVHPILGGYYP